MNTEKKGKGMTTNIINLSENRATILYQNKYYVVSDNGSETLIFESSPNGTITNWIEVGGAKDVTLTEVLSDFLSYFGNVINFE